MRVCSIEGCEKKHKAFGWCVMHYRRWQTHGDPLQRATEYGAKRRVGTKGYIYVWAPGHPLAHVNGYVAEHRKIAWDAGLLTDPADVVHHHNHDKADNRLENLAVTAKRAHDVAHAPERSRDGKGRFTGWRGGVDGG